MIVSVSYLSFYVWPFSPDLAFLGNREVNFIALGLCIFPFSYEYLSVKSKYSLFSFGDLGRCLSEPYSEFPNNTNVFIPCSDAEFKKYPIRLLFEVINSENSF